MAGHGRHQGLALVLHAAAGEGHAGAAHGAADVQAQRHAVGTLDVFYAREAGELAAQGRAEAAGGHVQGRDVGQGASQAVRAAQGHLHVADGQVEGLHHEVAVHQVGLNFLVYHQQGFQLGQRGQAGNLAHHLALVDGRPYHVKNPLAGERGQVWEHVGAHLAAHFEAGAKYALHLAGHRHQRLNAVEGRKGVLERQVLDVQAEVELRVRQVAAAVAARGAEAAAQGVERHARERGRLVAHGHGALGVGQLQVVVGHVVHAAGQHEVEELRDLQHPAGLGLGRGAAGGGRGSGAHLVHHPLVHVEVVRVHREVAAQRLAGREQVAQVVAHGARSCEVGAAGRAVHALQRYLVVVEGGRAAADAQALRQVRAAVGHVAGLHRAAGHHVLVAAGLHVGHVALGGNVAGHAAGHGHAFKRENLRDFGQVHGAAHVGIEHRLVEVVGREAAFERLALEHHAELRQVDLGVVDLAGCVHHRAAQVDVLNRGRELGRLHVAVHEADGRVHHRHLRFRVNAPGCAVHEQLPAHGQVLHRVHPQRLGQVHAGFHAAIHVHRRQTIDGYVAIYRVGPQVQMKLRDVDFHLVGYARGVVHL